MLGNGREAHLIRLSELGHGGITSREASQNSAPRGIGEGE
jgi:hypothetical protein